MRAETAYVPPYAGVRLCEYRDRIALVPVVSFREFYGYGKIKACEALLEDDAGTTELLWPDAAPDEEVWAVVQRRRFEDGHEEQGSIAYLRSPNTEEDARLAMQRMADFYGMSREELIELGKCFQEPDEDLDYIDYRHPNYQFRPTDPKAVDEADVYEARLRVLAGLQPKTVALIKQADEAKEPEERMRLKREAVAAYFAELAQHWPEEAVLAWQRSNPVGTEWMCEFARVRRGPKREIDPINYDLAFNWLRGKYNLLTAEELAQQIALATQMHVTPEAVKKRRERLGLTTQRLPGPPPKASQ